MAFHALQIHIKQASHRIQALEKGPVTFLSLSSPPAKPSEPVDPPSKLDRLVSQAQ